jgi:carboxyl-terminal processing protease
MHAKMYKLLKLWVMSSLLEYTDGKLPSKKQIDSLEPSLRKKANATLKRSVKRIIQSPQGIEYIIGNMYCQALASSYDPHTAYFPPDVKENFESDLGKKPMEYGVTFSKDDDGHAQIEYLKPGSAAYQSGRLNKGDKIQSIQWDKKEPIDVSDADVSEIERTLAATGGNTVNITVKKADGTSRQVALYKERLDIDDEEDKVKSFILQGDKKIGYISLPAFYSDWEDTRGVNGCANDVAKAIIRLKKENIEGLVIDLRYNGGGSVEEAVELSGIFIDAGPLAQIKTKAPKVLTLKDMVRGTIYDGPMILLVNGFSASASELVAAAMQDYNRALIVGSPTYGKATAQVVLPIDTAINIDTYDGKSTAGSYIKLTISKLYRLNGNTAQVTGVVPDIVLPDLTDASSQREANEKNAIPSSVIEPNKYYKPLSPLPVSAAQAIAKKEVAASNFFKYVQQYNDEVKEAHRKKDISLLLDDAVQKNQKPDLKSANDAAANERALYTVVNLAGQKQQSNTEQINKEWKNDLLTDSYIKVAFQVLGAMINK